MRTFNGVIASRGLAIGPVLRLEHSARSMTRVVKEPHKEQARFERAAARAKEELGALQLQANEADKDIFLFQQVLLDDHSLLEEIESHILAGLGAAEAVERAALVVSRRLASVEDPYIRERSTDVLDACHRVADILDGQPRRALTFTEPSVLVADEVYPSDLVGLEPGMLMGLATVGGSAQSHASIIARTMGLPAVIQLGKELMELQNGQTVALDASNGQLILEPGPQLLHQLEERHRSFVTMSGPDLMGRPCLTADGTRIHILANCTAPADIATAMALGAEGVGLLRSEFLLLPGTIPTEDEQYDFYCNCMHAAGGRPVTVRTYDIGADKLSSALPMPTGDNPALGLRGLRFAMAQPQLLQDQLCALLRAAARGPLKVMFPMVGSVQEWDMAMAEVEKAKEILRRRGTPFREDLPFGCMIEIPSAALTAGDIAAHGCAFFSIGTNDLVQYTCAADRMEPGMEPYYQQDCTAVRMLIRMTCEAADKAGIPVSVCGLTAEDPALACSHVRCGVRSLSMSAQSFIPVRDRLGRLNLSAAGRFDL
ncbi:MAG: phosphoenolpyruvate--protein phosphotransferase [Oscillospiraceae bacterium]|nr:phosphoenolpyruvate--protein phosphotransferase [Oscillospiraceae bacterium]